MKKISKNLGENNKYDFHFVVDKTPSMRKFVDEASKEDRPIAAQFRRIIEERYSK